VLALQRATVDRWEWDDRKREAVALLCESDLRIGQIADRLGIHRTTLHDWRQNPEFAAAVRELEQALAEEVNRFTIAKRAERVGGYDERRQLMLRVIRERGEWFSKNEPSVPGGGTGLLIKRHKIVGQGKDATALPEYEEATGLLKELRELEKQAAIEAGQWTERHEVDASLGVHVGPPTVLSFESQESLPTDANRDTEGWRRDETGEWLNAEGEVWRDDSHGHGLDQLESGAAEAIEPGETTSDAMKLLIEALISQLIDGEITRADYDAEVAKLRGAGNGDT